MLLFVTVVTRKDTHTQRHKDTQTFMHRLTRGRVVRIRRRTYCAQNVLISHCVGLECVSPTSDKLVLNTSDKTVKQCCSPSWEIFYFAEHPRNDK